jgi:selenocysteine-specific elongation factor
VPIVGTAGHVDHGKSALVEALTGIDPDRLAEEKRRGMTIDLGFAHMELPGVGDVGVVDVPGHARFLPNMLAGVHGMDAVLLVVAADEGVMPQTREHLDIVGLLEIDRLVVALTKVDLVDDTLAAAAEADVTAELERRGMTAPVLPVAAPQRRGVEAVREALAGVLATAAASAGDSADSEPGGPGAVAEAGASAPAGARLPIDRAFVIAGFGPVVTGSLVDGELRVGQQVEVVPSGRPRRGAALPSRPYRARIRGLHQHGRKVERAAAGSRVAANLQGVDRAQLSRGQVLAVPGRLAPTARVDLRLRVLPGAGALAHNARVAVFAGAAETSGRLVVLEGDEVAPGAEGWVQLRLAAPLALRAGDPLILRRRSPAETIAGGVAVDVDPPAHRRNRLDVIAGLARRRGSDASEDGGRRRHSLEAAAVAALGEFHRREPAREGMPREALRAPLRLPGRALGDALDAMVAGGVLEARGKHAVALPGWSPRLTAAQAAAVDRVLARLAEAPLSPPRTADLEADGLDGSVRSYIEEQGLATRVAPDLLMLPEALRDAEARLRQHLSANGATTVADARDVLASSRKTVVPLLEYFDAKGITRREGDRRTLRQ